MRSSCKFHNRKESEMNGLIYLVGLVVVILAVLSLFWIALI